MTPEQMRALAARMARRRSVTALDAEALAALRAAADQLEAVTAERVDLLAMNELALNQRDAIAEVLGMEPEWTEYDA